MMKCSNGIRLFSGYSVGVKRVHGSFHAYLFLSKKLG